MMIPRTRVGSVATPDGAAVPYLVIGEGPQLVVVIPGAGDGLTTAHEARRRLQLYFAARARRQRILYLSRRQPVPAGFSVAQHAADLAAVIEQLGWGPAVLECNSGGGPIGQVIAAEHPHLAAGLVLSCTLHRTVEHTRAVLAHWIALARRGDWAAFQWDSIARTFRPRTVARYRPLRPLLRWMPPPRDPARVIHVLEGLLELDQRPMLPRIACPVLVIGGADDQVIPRGVQEGMGALIPGSETILYPGYGHGNDQENPDYVRQVERFLAAVSQR